MDHIQWTTLLWCRPYQIWSLHMNLSQIIDTSIITPKWPGYLWTCFIVRNISMIETHKNLHWKFTSTISSTFKQIFSWTNKSIESKCISSNAKLEIGFINCRSRVHKKGNAKIFCFISFSLFVTSSLFFSFLQVPFIYLILPTFLVVWGGWSIVLGCTKWPIRTMVSRRNIWTALSW